MLTMILLFLEEIDQHRNDLDKSDLNLYEADKMRMEEIMQFNEFFSNNKTLPINQS